MKYGNRRRSNKSRILRWTALIITILITLYAALMMIGSAFEDDAPVTLGFIIFVVFMILTLSALFAAWRYELIGGVAGVFGALILGISVFFTAGHNQLPAALIISSPFFVAGILYVISSRISVKRFV